MTRVAVIVAHPDDEVLAFGGTMARHAHLGDVVDVLILATGLTSRTYDGAVDAQMLENLRSNARSACDILGVSTLELCDFPDNRMDSVALLDVIKSVERFIGRFRPNLIYTHHAGDLNVDHSVVARAVLTASRTLPGSCVRRVCAGEVSSSSEFGFPEDRFVPTSYVDIGAFIDRKCSALEAYTSELRQWPHPRSVETVRALAALRGSEVGVNVAEALRVVREVID